MRRHTALLFVAASLAVPAGCGPAFFQEAGSELESGDFGNATMNNTLTQANQESYAIDLTRRFAADVPNTVNFAFNSSTLDAAAQDALRKQAHWIRQFPEVRFRVFGHTDLVGSNEFNRALGMRRARAVVAFLATQGISTSRLEAVISEGETQPLVYVQGPEARNRRTVTEVSGFVANNPMILNGKYAAIIFREYVNSAEPAPTQEEVTEGSGAVGGDGGGG